MQGGWPVSIRQETWFMPSRDATQCDRNSYKREPGRRNRLKKPNLKNKFLSRRRETRLQLCPHHLRLLFSQKVFQTRQVLTACFPFFPVYFLLVFFLLFSNFPPTITRKKSVVGHTWWYKIYNRRPCQSTQQRTANNIREQSRKYLKKGVRKTWHYHWTDIPPLVWQESKWQIEKRFFFCCCWGRAIQLEGKEENKDGDNQQHLVWKNLFSTHLKWTPKVVRHFIISLLIPF